MEKRISITEYFSDLETTQEYNGYFCSVSEAITIVILGSMCGLRNVNQIHQWASSEKVREFLKEKFGIKNIPCYFWLLSLLKIIKPESLNLCFVKWVESILPEDKSELTLAVDGKTICSTEKMSSYENPLHIVSAQIAEHGLTFAQKTVESKSNEIPAVRALLKELNIKGCMVVADALNCQKETAKTIIAAKADYLLCVKDNQPNLKNDIKDYVDEKSLRKSMSTAVKNEKNRGRIEKRTAFVTTDIDWLENKEQWGQIVCICAINTEFTTKNGKSSEWHYYISSRELTANQLLHHARLEWSVETLHWLLDVHFGEDFCRIEDKNVQQNLNMLRKLVINVIKLFKAKAAPKRPISRIMFDCLLDSRNILSVLNQN